MTEEVWSWRFAADEGRQRSIHTSAWPTKQELAAIDLPANAATYDLAAEVLGEIRSAKSTAQKSLRWPIASLEIVGPEARRNALAPVIDDILRAGAVAPDGLVLKDGEAPEGERFSVTVTLGDDADAS